MDDLLQVAMKQHASDLHIAVGLPPVFRVDGKLLKAPFEPFTPESSRRIVLGVLSVQQKQQFEECGEFEFTYWGRPETIVRVACFYDRGTVVAALRVLSHALPTLESLNTPPIIERIAQLTHGLILFTGASYAWEQPVAAFVDAINRTRVAHIVTAENPILYFHTHKKSLVHQREIGADTPSVRDALRSVARSDADVVVIPALRDVEMMRTALALAGKNRLVVSAMSTVSAPSTVARYVDSFPVDEQAEIRLTLSNNLHAVVTCWNVPKTDGTGRVLALEVLLVTPQIRALIREEQTQQIEAVIKASSNLGMITITQSLLALYRAGTITREMALAYSPNRIDTEAMLNESAAGNESLTAPQDAV